MKYSNRIAEEQGYWIRLSAISRAAFSTHPRTSMLLSAFMEGINLHRTAGADDVAVLSRRSQGANGFELLRQLARHRHITCVVVLKPYPCERREPRRALLCLELRLRR